ncbi:fatty acid desaturase [Natronocella acetinitrilica]|uniref:Fatty acid desaturase n=1 Tax=Natronocella acetinitrilica TaxID=414046 RepID=A0AAE3G211_9GAMM|nr:hypothetical protein [Natronocella acetinitrilica]MCP1673952.1 fatty acid desaturase [Natronocella acetinitrilica]
MQDWTVVRALYDDCGRAGVLRRLLFSNLLSVSGVMMLAFIALALVVLLAAPWLLSGYMAALAVAILMPLLMWLGALILDERIRAAYPEHSLARRPLLAAYRRGFFGVRYLEFLDRLRLSGLFDPAALQTALRCCEAELALQNTPEMRLSRARPIWLALLAVALLAGAPYLAQWYPEWVPLVEGVAVVFAILAVLFGTMLLAQPAIAHHRELHCMLVWALEEARAEPPPLR